MLLPPTLVVPLFASFIAARKCSNFSIPVDISSRQGLFKQVPVESNLDAGAFALRSSEYGTNYSATLLSGFQTLKKSYNISAQYCQPDTGNTTIIQLLTHGIGFDKTYWDLSYHDYEYSYVKVALISGYSTLSIDRLGIGKSSHGDPLNEIQAQAEVEALNAITTKLRTGSIPEIGRTYQKVVHVGHSFGSVQSFWLSALYPNNTDGLVLTGYSATAQFLPYILAGWNLHSARLNQPFRLGNASNAEIMRLASSYGVSKDIVPGIQTVLRSTRVILSASEMRSISQTELLDLINGYNTTSETLDYPSGYMVSSDLTTLQYAFLFPGKFDEELALIAESTKQPVTTGELLTIGSAPSKSAFKGPVLVFTGEHDVPFCGGNCLAKLPGSKDATLLAGVKEAFPNASHFEALVQAATGHGNNFHYKAAAGYEVIQNWLASNGLKP